MRGAVLTSVLALGAQLTSMLLQLVFAALFGSSPEADAYFAALALPTFVSALFVAAVPVVFIPVVIERRALVGRGEGDAVSNATINQTALLLGILVLGGATFSDGLLRLTAPGLSPAEHALAQRIAIFLWPSAAASCLVALMTALWQIESRFGWPASVPLAGTAANLLLLALLVPGMGITGAALAWTASVFLQMILLAPVIWRRWRPRLSLAHPAVREIARAVWPLILSNTLIQASTIWERYLGSLLPIGQLSQLTYASRIVLSISVLLSAGPAAVILPRLAEVAAEGDRVRLGRAIEKGLRSMWLVVAPAGALLIVLADPAVELVFQRGAFTHEDARAVAGILRVYVMALVPGLLAVVTSRALYARKATRLVAIVGAGEGLAYLAYTAWLSSILGAVGIALGFALLASVSLVWHLVYLRRVTGAPSVRSLAPFAVSGIAAVLAGLTALGVSQVATGPLAAVAIGGTAGVAVYAVGLLAGHAVESLVTRRPR